MKIIKTKNGIQVRELSPKQAIELGDAYGIYNKEFGDYIATAGNLNEAMEWLDESNKNEGDN